MSCNMREATIYPKQSTYRTTWNIFKFKQGVKYVTPWRFLQRILLHSGIIACRLFSRDAIPIIASAVSYALCACGRKEGYR